MWELWHIGVWSYYIGELHATLKIFIKIESSRNWCTRPFYGWTQKDWKFIEKNWVSWFQWPSYCRPRTLNWVRSCIVWCQNGIFFFCGTLSSNKCWYRVTSTHVVENCENSERGARASVWHRKGCCIISSMLWGWRSIKIWWPSISHKGIKTTTTGIFYP